VRAPFCTAVAAVALLVPLQAQLPQADAAFQRGDYRGARAAYERVLAADSTNVRALHQLAILDSWSGKLAHSLERLGRLRRLVPADQDVMVDQARVLAWAGRTQASEALYDSVLARSPGRTDALAGQARAVAWRGDLVRAERLWREALTLHPDDAELLIGLAQTLYWKGQPELAEAYAARARALAPGDRAALELQRALRAALRPELVTSSDGAGDSDDNAFVALYGSYTTSLGADVRGTLAAGWRHATDPFRAGASYGARGVAVAALGGGAVLRAGAGVRRLEPEGGAATTPLTAELGLGIRPGRYAAAGIGYSRTAFDETALLIDSGFVIDAVDANLDVSPSPHWSVSAGGGVAWLSDGNRRASAVLAVLGRAAPGLQLGPFARVLSYDTTPGHGYFAPDRFTVLEGRAIYDWRRDRWGVRADGGAGTQQVFKGAARQFAWHVGMSLTRSWGANNEIALVGALTNSAGATATSGTRTEGFRYRTLALRFRQGL